MSEGKKGIQEGPPLYMETLLSWDEWRSNLKNYKTCHLEMPRTLSEFKAGEFKCRYRMGGGLDEAEILLINNRLHKMRQEAGVS